MKAKVMKIQQKDSKYGNFFYYVFFKGEDKKSYRTCVSPTMRNYVNWEDIIKEFLALKKKDIWLENLTVLSVGKQLLVDADSKVMRCAD